MNNCSNIFWIIINKYLYLSGATLANIDDAPIKLRGFKLYNCFDSIGGITSKMLAHYKTDFV